MDFELYINTVDLLKTTYDGAKYALNSYKTGDIETFANIMENIENAIANINQKLLPLSTQLEELQCFNIIDNLQNSLKNLENRINNGEFKRGEIILEFEIVPLLAELKEDLYFFTLIYPDKSKMDQYYKNEFARNHQNEYLLEGKTRFNVSIVVTAWNKLDYTKLCIENIFKYTDFKGLNCELITINHGSTDGTEEFFETLPHEKKINLKNNMCAISLTYPPRIVEGRYYVNISNDIIVTKNWLENMLRCMEEDNTTAVAVPTTPNISNYQSIDVQYNNIEEMHSFAENFNVSNSDLWEERVRLCPAVEIINMDIVNKIGFCDRYFRYMEFTDDDAGVRFRRSGYKQILLRDTYCHHFGSVTLGTAQKKNSTIEKSRKLFSEKHGYDPWGLGFCYDLNVIKSLDFNKKGHINILGIDAGVGSTPLQIKNELKRKGNRDVTLYNFATDGRFDFDLKLYSDVFIADDIKDLKNIFVDEKFDYIYVGKEIEEYHNYNYILQILNNKLCKGGSLIINNQIAVKIMKKAVI